MKHQTVKLCRIRNCNDETHEPCPCDKLDPCSVFRDLESGQWYYEATAQRVLDIPLEDGSFFKAQDWLEQTYNKSFLVWNPGTETHEANKTNFRRTKTREAAKAPQYTAIELDQMVDTHIRNRLSAKDAVRRIHELASQISGMKKFMGKYGENETIKIEVEILTEELEELQATQDKFRDISNASREHAQDDRAWENRWVKPRGRTMAIIYLYSVNGKMYEINSNGLTIDMEYVYLPELHARYFECMDWAEKNLGIERSKWIQARIEDDIISTPIRTSGKKNANGRRIQDRMQQTRFAEETTKFKWDLFNNGVSMHELHYGEHTRNLYEETVREKLQRR